MAENILHFAAIRLRVVGIGNVKLRLISLDDTIVQELLPLPMSEVMNIEPTRICNFSQQRARIKIYTDEFGEFLKVNRVIYYVKEKYTSYPG